MSGVLFPIGRSISSSAVFVTAQLRASSNSAGIALLGLTCSSRFSRSTALPGTSHGPRSLSICCSCRLVKMGIVRATRLLGRTTHCRGAGYISRSVVRLRLPIDSLPEARLRPLGPWPGQRNLMRSVRPRAAWSSSLGKVAADRRRMVWRLRVGTAADVVLRRSGRRPAFYAGGNRRVMTVHLPVLLRNCRNV